MKETDLTKAIDKLIALKMRAIDIVIEELVEPLANVGNPEKLLGKPYEEWQHDKQTLSMLSQIYGEEEPNPLSELIFRKTLEKVEALEQEEL